MKDAKARLRRKKVYSVFDIGRLPVTDENGQVVNIAVEPQPKTLAGFIAREEAARRESELAAQRERDAATEAEHDVRLKAFYSQDPDVLTNRVGMRDDYCPLEESASEPDAGTKFIAGLTAQGVTLSQSAKGRIAAYAESQNAHSHGRLGVTERNLNAAYSRLKSVGAFGDGEITERLRVEPVAVPERTDPILEAVIRLGCTNPAWQSMFQMWRKSVYDNFGHQLNQIQCEQAFIYIVNTGLNPLSADAWNAGRRSLVARALVPSSLLTAREVLESQLSDGTIDAATMWQRSRTLALEGKLDRPRSEAGHA